MILSTCGELVKTSSFMQGANQTHRAGENSTQRPKDSIYSDNVIF